MKNGHYFNVAPGIWGMRTVLVNLYMVAAGGQKWILIDTGIPGSAQKIMEMAEEIFGADNPPEAILMTHGHFDHRGSVQALLKHWNVPVFAHHLELPYLQGKENYPDPDPTAGGGLMSAISFLYPKKPINLGAQVRPLPSNLSVPYLPDWTYLHTPGHTPGHVSFFRKTDKVLIAGDAFVTIHAESAIDNITLKRTVSGPPKYFTPNWISAAFSVKKLRDLRPAVAATGHGLVMRGEALNAGLDALANNFQELAMPKHGRYVAQPYPSEKISKNTLAGVLAVSAVIGFFVVRSLKQR